MNRDLEHIVAAALKFGEIIVSQPPPARHHTLLRGMFDIIGKNEAVPIGADDQGFLTNTGRFVDRKEAAELAVFAGQITMTKFQPNTLFSEDLW